MEKRYWMYSVVSWSHTADGDFVSCNTYVTDVSPGIDLIRARAPGMIVWSGELTKEEYEEARKVSVSS